VTSVLPSTADKPRFVAAMFGRIAPRYDLMNTLMTFGQDARWRRSVAESLTPTGRGGRVLDVGAGTGQLASAVHVADPTRRVVGVDFALEMLRQSANQAQRVHLAAGDAQRLPFADAQFDAVVSGFLVRNLSDAERGLREQVRVLRPGGVLVVLETTPGPPGWLRPGYRLYFRQIVPRLGRLITGDASAYTYLPESTLAFVQPARVVTMLQRCGLFEVRTRGLMFGTVALTTGYKPAKMLGHAGGQDDL
jgi:demethylmenaquinone methyltransferase/2-methoxy-6-polyprenyl-1,4-benzoquinol methylase